MALTNIPQKYKQKNPFGSTVSHYVSFIEQTTVSFHNAGFDATAALRMSVRAGFVGVLGSPPGKCGARKICARGLETCFR